MTRTVSESNLSTLAARARLKPRDKPYFRKIDIGLHLGYGKGTTPGGKWSLRKYLGAERYKRETLGIADDHVAADGVRVLSFAQAVRRALDRAAGPPIGPLTVAEAMEAYFERLEQKGKRAVEARARADRHIVKALGDRPVDSLTRDMLDLWLAGLVRGKDADAKRASQASANRILTILKAGLNQALKDKKAAPNDAWRHCEPFADVNKPRLRFFSMEESRRLLNAAQGGAVHRL